MGDYMFLCIVIINMVLASKAFPQESQQNTFGRKPKEAAAGSQVLFQKRNVPDMPRTAGGNADDDEIIFETTPLTTRVQDYFSAKGKGYDCVEGVCDNAVDYPYEYLKQIKNQLSQFESAFGGFEGNYVNFTSKHGDPDAPQAEPLCGVQSYTKFPKTLKTESNIEKFIVNVENLKQGVIFETCLKTASCGDASFPTGFVSECTQKYSIRRLLSLEGKDGKPTQDSFIVPSCCVCMITKKPKN